MSLLEQENKITHPSESWDPLLLFKPNGFNRGSGPRIKSGVVLLFAALFFPAIVSAKMLEFGDKSWDIIPSFAGFATNTPVRSDFDLTDLAKNSLTGAATFDRRRMLSETTIKQIEDLAEELNQETQDAKLVIENNRAIEFDPGQNGQTLDLYQTAKLLALDDSNLFLPVYLALPQTTLPDTNNLGINELVAFGESNFTGSPKNRIHNINVGAKKFDGVILATGEEFSFNKYLGEVDGEHGFLPELVIKRTGVTPEFGGGLCQVSSTAFRATMNTGLPIIERRNHSFAVQYYAPQGTDATIYPGSTDLRFINNLPTAMLIHTKIVGKKLYFEYYGTKDDRQITFEGPTVYDKKSDGSMKATWTRHVTQNNQVTTQVFKSTYLPPALFHPETTASPTPQPPLTQSQ